MVPISANQKRSACLNRSQDGTPLSENLFLSQLPRWSQAEVYTKGRGRQRPLDLPIDEAPRVGLKWLQRCQGGRLLVKTALITGITGQDGVYLAEYLLQKDYRVFGLIRGQNNPKKEALLSEFPAIQLVPGDLLDQSSLFAAVEKAQPDEIYHLGAISFIPFSFQHPELT